MEQQRKESLAQTSNSFSEVSNTILTPPKDKHERKLRGGQQPEGNLQKQQSSIISDPAYGQSHIRRGSEQNTCAEKIFVALSYLLAAITFPLSLAFCLTTSNVYERIVILRLGRIRGIKGPGLIFVLPCVDDVFRVDLRLQSLDVEPQELLTKDSVSITVDAVVYFKIFKPLDAVCQVYDVRAATQLLAQTTLRNVLGTKNLVEVLTSKDVISHTLGQILDEATDPWGVKVERVEMKDLRLPISMQRAMAAEAEALREAKAKIIAAEGELNSSKALKEASDIMASNPITLQNEYSKEILLHLLNIHSKNIELPINMQRAMAKEQQAVREAEAKIVAAKGELTASENLKLASDVIKASPIAIQLRYLQTINAISNKKSHTIIVPYPQAMIKKFLKRK